MARILVVEDEVVFRSVLSLALTEAGHAVLEASNGRLALEVLKAEKVDLILADVLMPESDGFEMIVKLRGSTHPTPVIVMTGGHPNTELYLKVAQSLGAQRVLAKPFATTELLERIRDVLGN